MKIELKRELVPLIVIVGMFIAGSIAYPYLSDKLPIHWNSTGAIDGYIDKNSITVLGAPLIALLLWILLTLLPKIDPKKEKYTFFKREYEVIKITIISFFAFLYTVIIITSSGHTVNTGKMMPCAVGVIVIVLGNTMGKIRQNYFVGFKLPWTLENEDVWNRTHRLGGKLMVLAGVLTIGGSFISPIVAMVVLLSSIGVMIAVTIVYSYRLYKKIKKGV